MSDNDKNFADDHSYDGIQELDNPLPRWWLWTFYITVVFSAFYIPYYHFLGGQNPIDEYQSDIAKLEAEKKSAPSEENGDQKIIAALGDAQVKAKGAFVFDSKCAVCHGKEGQGIIGPNLTDNYWINGDGSPTTVAKVINEGVPAKGMPPWASVLQPEELVQVAVFVVSLKGSTPANPKAPQGELK
ncbi:MAG: cbb3-type cytochrome c oxidase N-terminal domain-containing protein [Bdellovibrionales bacterium]